MDRPAAAPPGLPDVRTVTALGPPGTGGPWAIELSPSALASITHEVAVGGRDLETGGILLGHETATAAVIDIAGGPGAHAVRGPRNFSRDLQHATDLADQAWHESRAIWLGDWHTHPQSAPVPSDVDLASYARHLSDPDLGFTRFVSLIVGLLDDPALDYPSRPTAHPPQPVIAAWVVDARGALPSRLTVTEENRR